MSHDAEDGVLAGEIARCIATMTGLTVPTVSVLLDQGCDGAALAMLPTYRVSATEHAWLSTLPSNEPAPSSTVTPISLPTWPRGNTSESTGRRSRCWRIHSHHRRSLRPTTPRPAHDGSLLTRSPDKAT